MKNLHIENSYNIWRKIDIINITINKCYEEFNSRNPEEVLNRTYLSLYIEWILHNIGYYITKPFCFIGVAHKINLRCKDVDLEEWNRIW